MTRIFNYKVLSSLLMEKGMFSGNEQVHIIEREFVRKSTRGNPAAWQLSVIVAKQFSSWTREAFHARWRPGNVDADPRP